MNHVQNRILFPLRRRLAGAALSPLLALLLAMPVTSGAAAFQPGPAVNAEIAQLAAQAGPAAVRSRRPLDARQLLPRLYEPGAPASLWLNDGLVQAKAALQLLNEAPAYGLVASDYKVADLSAWLNAPAPATAASFEIAMSTAMLQFLADLHFGRVTPDFQVPSGEVRRAEFDPVKALRAGLKANRLAAAVDEAEPKHLVYRGVKANLARYRQLEKAAPAWPALPPLTGSKLLPGETYGGVPLLRERLALFGDLSESEPGAAPTLYSEALAKAMGRFQSRHGLEPDGVVGAGTLAALSVPVAKRVRQLELTLERLRWLPPLRPGRVIAVNLPIYRLWAFDNTAPHGGNPLEMRVIVGTAVKNQTPLFVGQMSYLEFNPYWNVPRSIELGEIIPKLAANPAYLQQHEMEVVTSGGTTQTDGAAALAALRAGGARVRQRPGAQNALGAVKFAMPNSMNIYLHSTSAKGLFNKQRRDLSHGCIRVERPAELAAYVLSDQPKWTQQAVDTAMKPGASVTVRLKEEIPVVLFYATAVADGEGRALFAEDIYKRDPKLEQALVQTSTVR